LWGILYKIKDKRQKTKGKMLRAHVSSVALAKEECLGRRYRVRHIDFEIKLKRFILQEISEL
jgi:hypothetical protein